MKILIPNVTGPNNIGDEAILHGLLLVFNKAFGSYELTLHTYEPEKYPSNFVNKVDYTIYSWTAFQNRNLLTRIIRLLEFFDTMLDLTLFRRIVGNKKIRSLLYDYKNANLVYLVGGGYLRARAGLTQSLNLIMQLMIIWAATRLNKNVVIGPISFGPFAYKWQEFITAKILASVPTILVREKISLEKLQGYQVENTQLLIDTAFFLPKIDDVNGNEKGIIIGFSARDWGNKRVQQNFVKNFTSAMQVIGKRHFVILQPMVQVHSPEYSVSDLRITSEIVKLLIADGLEVLPTLKIENVPQAVSSYAKLDCLIGVRMHSVIISATQHVPVIAIAYEHKTEGIMNMLGLSDYVCSYHKVHSEKLAVKLNELLERRKVLADNLKYKIFNLYQTESVRLRNILRQYQVN